MYILYMDQQLLNSISELQDREKQLHMKFHSNSPELKRRSLEEMVELTRLRVELFNKLKSSYVRDITESRDELDDQLATLHIVETELNQSQKELKRLNQQYVDKMRMVEISTYFSEKYKSYNQLFKLIIFWMIPIGILVFIGLRNPVPENYVSKDNSNTIFLAIIMVLCFVALYQILVLAYDLSIRNNMNFNEYNFGASFDFDEAVSKMTPPGMLGSDHDGKGAVAYDVKQFEKAAESLNLGCVDSYCCADGTMYDSVKKQCIPSIKNHLENTKKAALTKGSMSATQDQAVSKSQGTVEAFSSDNVPFSSV